MARKSVFRIVWICLSLLIIGRIVYSQELPKIAVVEIKEVKPFPIPHLGKYADRKVIFKITNSAKDDIIVFGVDVEGQLQPVRYLLTLNKKLNIWEYPTRDGKPVTWKKVSETYKKERVLKSGESLTFYNFFSSETDCGQSNKVSVQIKPAKSKKTYEILSDEFTTDQCKQ